MDNYQIKYTQASYNDIMQISIYITYTLLEPEISKQFIKSLLESIRSLDIFPFRYPIIHYLKLDYILHCKPFKNFYIFYSIDETLKEVDILRILYNKRDLTKLL